MSADINIKLGQLSFHSSYQINATKDELTLMDGTVEDSTNIDNYYDSTNEWLTQDMYLTTNDNNGLFRVKNIIPKNTKRTKIDTTYGFVELIVSSIYNVYKNGIPSNCTYTSAYGGTYTITVNSLTKIYKMEIITE